MTPEETFGQLLGLGKAWRVVEGKRAVNLSITHKFQTSKIQKILKK
jgi:hypothetical protein